MPLVDQFGREVPIQPKRKYTRRPKNKPAKARRSSRSNQILSDNRNVEVMLAARHNINGQQYGPGRVVVPGKIAQVLLEGERRAAWSDANFAGTRACVIGPGRTKGGLSIKEVAPEFFDTANSGAIPFGVVDKSGQFEPN